MNYEVLLSDTAQTDLEHNTNEAIPMLLERLAQSAEYDHVLSAEKASFELRYQTLGKSYVFFRRSEDQVTVIYFCEMSVPPAVLPVAPQLRLIEYKSREIPHGMEIESVMEMTNSDGTKAVHHQLMRKIDMGDSYVLIRHTKGGTMIMTGKKGPVEGDSRRDELEMLCLMPDGTVKRFPPLETPVWIKNPYEGDGRPLEERVRDYVRSPRFQERMDAARKWVNLG